MSYTLLATMNPMELLVLAGIVAAFFFLNGGLRFTTEQQTRLTELNTAARKIIDEADARGGGKGKGTLTQEESEKVDKIYADYDALKAQVEEEEKQTRQRARLEEHEQFMSGSAGRRTTDGGNTGGSRARSAEAPTVLEVGRHKIELAAGSPEAHRATAEYRAAYADYLATGKISNVLVTTNDAKAGYLSPMQMGGGLIKFLDDQVFMRQLATVLPPLTVGSSLGVLSYDTDPGDADWTAEVPASDISEDTAMAFGKREMTPHLATKLIKVSRKLLRSATLNVESFVQERLGYKFAITQEKGFLTGTGVKQPLGVFIASTQGVSTGRDVTCASATAFTADEIIDLLFNLKGQYQRNATGLFHRTAVQRIRKLKDGNGQYLWQPGLGGNPATILDRPYVMSEYVPNTFTSGLYVGMFADFRAGYAIVDSLNLEIERLNELFRLKNTVGIIGALETDGMPVLEEAFSRLKLGA